MNAVAARAGRRQEWEACLAIANHALAQYRAQGGLWLSLVLLVAFLSFAALAWWQYLGGGDAKLVELLILCTATSLGSLLLIWNTRLSRSLFEQATATSLRLVPGMRRRVGTVFGVLVFSAGVLAALVVGVPLGRPGLVLVVTCLALVEATMMSGWRVYALFGAVFAVNGLIPLPSEFLLGEGGLALALVMLAVESPNALRHLVGTGTRLPRRPSAPATWLKWPDAGAVAPEQYASQDDLLAGILGPMVDPRGAAKLALVVVLFASASRFEPFSRFVSTQSIHANILIVLPILLAGMSHSVVTKIYANARELALLRLSPLAPPAADINRMLASWLVRRYVAQWFLYTVLATAALLVSGAGPQLAAQAMGITGFTVFWAGYVLRDYSRPRRSTRLMNLFGMTLALAGFAYLFLALVGNLTGAMHVVAEIAFAGGGVFTWYRWRQMVGAPPAFPAGRGD